MARFHCFIRPLAALAAHAGSHAVVSALTLRALQLDDGAAPELQGPGWFDSSWELARGLDVREGLPGDAGVYEWLDVCLRADAVAGAVAAIAAAPQRALRAPSLATSRATASPTSITAIA